MINFETLNKDSFLNELHLRTSIDLKILNNLFHLNILHRIFNKDSFFIDNGIFSINDNLKLNHNYEKCIEFLFAEYLFLNPSFTIKSKYKYIINQDNLVIEISDAAFNDANLCSFMISILSKKEDIIHYDNDYISEIDLNNLNEILYKKLIEKQNFNNYPSGIFFTNSLSLIYVDTENDKSDIFKSLDQQIKLFNEYYINSIQELLDENKSIIEFYISKKQLVNF